MKKALAKVKKEEMTEYLDADNLFDVTCYFSPEIRNHSNGIDR